MGKHLKKFNTEEQIQSALNNGSLLKPYIALYNDEINIDYNTKEDVSNPFRSISVSNDIEYSFDGEITWFSTGIESANINYIKVNSIPQNIKNYILNGNHNRWYILETPILLETLTISDNGNDTKLEIITPYSNSNYDIDTYDNYNEINMVKYDEITQTLYLSRGNFYYCSEIENDYIQDILFQNLRDISTGGGESQFNGLKIFYDNSINNFTIIGAEILNVETNDNKLIYDFSGDNVYHTEWNLNFIPSYIIDHIESYLNNTWDGSEESLSTFNLAPNTCTTTNYGGNNFKISIVNNYTLSDTTYEGERLLITNNNSIYILFNLTTLTINASGLGC